LIEACDRNPVDDVLHGKRTRDRVPSLSTHAKWLDCAWLDSNRARQGQWKSVRLLLLPECGRSHNKKQAMNPEAQYCHLIRAAVQPLPQ
jgi:hypothetical protein